MNTYLEKHRFCERQINSPVVPDTNIIVVIPCYNEPALLKTLQSLFDCARTFLPVEVIITLNSGEHDGDGVINQNKETFIDANDWIKKHQHEKLFFQINKYLNIIGKKNL